MLLLLLLTSFAEFAVADAVAAHITGDSITWCRVCVPLSVFRCLRGTVRSGWYHAPHF